MSPGFEDDPTPQAVREHVKEHEFFMVAHTAVSPSYPPQLQTPFEATESGGVKFHEHKMEIDRPYPFRVAGIWFIAIRKSVEEGDVRIYQPE